MSLLERFEWVAVSMAMGWLALAPERAEAAISFTEVAAASGITDVRCHSVGGHGMGVNWLDYDRDGLPDLFVACGSAAVPARLFHNLGGGSFAEVTELLGTLPLPTEADMGGAAAADWDNDGDPDLLIFTDTFYASDFCLPPPDDQYCGEDLWIFETLLSGGEAGQDGPADIVLRNRFVENGGRVIAEQPLFERVTPSVLEDLASPPFGALPGLRSKTGGFLDYDADGCLDAYVGHFIPNGASLDLPGNRDRLYQGDCAGGFTDVTVASGIGAGSAPSFNRSTLAYIAAHLDDDLAIDVYVDHATGSSTQDTTDFLLGNDGDGTFTDLVSQGLAPGIGNDSAEGMGIDVADIDLDGDWDLYIGDSIETRFEAAPHGNVLYLGNPDGTFSDNVAPAAGVVADFTWPTLFFDADQDGYEDLYVGYGGNPAPTKYDFLYRNDQDGTFTDVGTLLWPKTPSDGLQTRGASVADYDADGDLDLVKVYDNNFDLMVNPPLGLWRNDTTEGGSWLQIALVGCASNRDAIGAVVELDAPGLPMRRQVKNVLSAKSQNENIVHFGLAGGANAEALRVRWPSGLVTEVLHGSAGFSGPDSDSLAASRRYTIVEGAGTHAGFRFSRAISSAEQDDLYEQLSCPVPEASAASASSVALVVLIQLRRMRRGTR